MIETLIYDIIIIIIVGVIWYLLFNSKSKNSDNCHRVVEAVHELSINNREKKNSFNTSDIDNKKLKSLEKTKDNLQVIKGVGKILEGVLNDNGIYHLEQIANWTDEEIERMDRLTSFSGRIKRGNWREQAKELINI